MSSGRQVVKGKIKIMANKRSVRNGANGPREEKNYRKEKRPTFPPWLWRSRPRGGSFSISKGLLLINQ